MYASVVGCCGCTPRKRQSSLLGYLLLLLFSVVLALVLRFNFSGWLSRFFYDSFDDCDTCVGYGAVFRVSFATWAFFITHALLLLCRPCYLVDVYSWLPKILYWLALIVVAFALPDPFYSDAYVHVARVVAGAFLVLQLVILVDFAHALNEKWNAAAETQPVYKFAIVGSSLLLLMGAGAALVLLFIYRAECGLHKFFIGFTLATTLVIIVLCITEKFAAHGKGGLLPPSIVTLYAYWLCYSAIESNPASCAHNSQDSVLQLVLSLLLLAGSITYAAWNLATSAGELFGSEEAAAARSLEEKDEAEPALPPSSSAAAAGTGSAIHPPLDVERQEDPASAESMSLVARRNRKFHCMMAAGAMYAAMLLTNWGSMDAAEDLDSSSDDDSLTGRAYDLSAESMWIKIVSQWFTLLLFTWSVIAPVVCSGRDFS